MSNNDKFKKTAERNLLYFYIKGDNIVNCSNSLSKQIKDIDIPYKSIFPDFDISKEVQLHKVKDIPYLFTSKKVIIENERYILVYINNKIGVFYQTSNTAIGVVHIDNYDIISSKLSSEQLSLKTAILYTKLALLASNYNFLLLELTKNTYIIFMDGLTLSTLKSEKFSFVEELKQINLDADMDTTLSIGIADGFNTLTESYEIAKAAVDFAISRGGDQIAIKDPQKYTFFGGVADNSTNFNKVRSRVKAKLLQELYNDSKNIIIMGHKNPDLDSLGSAIAFSYLAKTMGIPCNIVLDEQNRTYERMMNMIDDSEYEELFIDKKTADTKIKKNTLVIVVDVHKPSLTEYPELLYSKKIKRIALFDHHRRGVDYIEGPILEYHEASSSSTCELVTDMLLSITDLPAMPPNIADALLAGITLDTKWFTFKVSARTFECAAELQKLGANTVNIHKLLQNNFDEYKLKHKLINTAEIYYDKIAIAIQENAIENQSIIVSQASDDLLTFVGIEVSFVISQNVDHIHVSARSQGDINVQIIMEHFDGGGHKTMAACRIYDTSIDEVKANILSYMREHIL